MQEFIEFSSPDAFCPHLPTVIKFILLHKNFGFYCSGAEIKYQEKFKNSLSIVQDRQKNLQKANPLTTALGGCLYGKRQLFIVSSV